MQELETLIIGANGQLGLALRAAYPSARAVDANELDITDPVALDSFDWTGIKYVLNAAAYTNVPEAENPKGRQNAWHVNATAVGYLAKHCREHSMTLVQISTGYVFDGTTDMHTEAELLSPLSSYGASKAAGDIAAAQADKYYIVRTSAVIGEGKNFVRSIFELGRQGISPKVVADETDRPTFTSEIVRGIAFILDTEAPYGVYNVTNSGDVVTWAELARTIFLEAGYSDVSVIDSTAAEYFAGQAIADKRPSHGALALSKMENLGFTFTDWREDLKKYINSEQDRIKEQA